jgi:hypothetical protein
MINQKRYDWCYKHNREHTGFTTLYCPDCVVEAEISAAQAKESFDKALAADRMISFSQKPSSPPARMNFYPPSVGNNPIPVNVSPPGTPSPGQTWDMDGYVLSYDNYVITPNRGYLHVFEMEPRNNRLGSIDICMLYIFDKDMVELAKNYTARRIQLSGIWTPPGMAPLSMIAPYHKQKMMPAVLAHRHHLP